MDYKLIQSKALEAITKTGQKVSLSRDDAVLLSTYGVFSSSTKKADGEANATKMLIILPGSIKYAPRPGDYIIAGTTTYYVSEVEYIAPGIIPIIFKATVI
jgi:hypothetical protein